MIQKYFVKTSVLLIVFCLGIFLGVMVSDREEATAQIPSVTTLSTNSLLGQEMTAEQKEVWAFVIDSWDAGQKENLVELLDYYHTDLSNWDSTDAIPKNRNSLKLWMQYAFENHDVSVCEVQPLVVRVYEGFAFAQYLYQQVYKNEEGKQVEEKGRYTEIYVKQEGNWKILVSHGGPDLGN